MKLSITGSRSITDKTWVFNQIDNAIAEINKKKKTPVNIVILSGGAKGVDTLAREYAEEKGLDFVLFKPYHMVDNKVPFETKYFFARNRQLADNADVCLVLYDGVSHGTKHFIDHAAKKGKPVGVVTR